MGITWNQKPSTIFRGNAEKWTNAIITSGRQVATQRAEDIEQWMKDNAPWQDRTGDARDFLTAEAVPQERYTAQIVMSHGVDYGIWLEVAHQGRYAILAQAVDYWGPIVQRDLELIARFGRFQITEEHAPQYGENLGASSDDLGDL